MQLRKSTIGEYNKVKAFYWDLIDEMQDQSNTVGWKKGIYPTDEFLRDSITSGELYVIDGEQGLIASVILNNSWNDGYNGITWSIECPREGVLVPHALAVKPDVQGNGIGAKVVQDIIDIARSEGKKTIRLDILGGNIAAEKLYVKMGFRPVESKLMFYEDTGWTEFFMYEIIL